jgi:hypothetical protein
MIGLWVVAAFCAQLVCPAFAQRHLPDVQIFTTDETIQLDTEAEYPAINKGFSSAAIPARGENLSIQIFIPRSGGLLGYECAITFANADSALAGSFQILSVTDWRQQPLKQVSSTRTISFYTNRLAFSPLPNSGHIVTALLTPRQQIQSPVPIQIDCSVTVVSDPPRRVWQMKGSQILSWR